MQPSSSSSSRKFCLLVLLLALVAKVRSEKPLKVFNVKRFGAVGDGRTDNSKAFRDAFNRACQCNGHGRIVVPRGTFLVKSAMFKGPCRGPIDFKLRGTVRASAGPMDKDKWISFRYIDRLRITGGGTFDGQGETSWPYNDCNKNPNCQAFPISVRLDFVTNSLVRGVRFLNSKNFHLNVFACTNVKFQGLRITAPAESPNTDGIHLGHSRDIVISDSVIATGDDCVSIGPGSHDVEVLRVMCGPGHGISIGSLGKYPDELDVSGIRVRNCVLDGTDNGLRIKTWASPLKSKVYNVSYQNVIMKNVYNPIVIDQLYCPSGNCDNTKASSVQIRDVWFKHIRGTSKTRDAVTLKCSRRYPCKNINLKDINLSYNGPEGPVGATCSNVVGSASGVQKPKACIR